MARTRPSSAMAWSSPYMGPPEEKPVFPEFDTYNDRPADNKLVAVSAFYPCNWLQVHTRMSSITFTSRCYTIRS